MSIHDILVSNHVHCLAVFGIRMFAMYMFDNNQYAYYLLLIHKQINDSMVTEQDDETMDKRKGHFHECYYCS